MEENTYLRKIDCLNSCLTGENAKEILKEVDALEKWKPVISSILFLSKYLITGNSRVDYMK